MNCHTVSRLILSALFLLSATIVFAATESIHTITVAQDGSGDYNTVGEALRKVRGDMDYTTRIFIKNGRYHEKLTLNVTAQNLIIEGENPDSTIITYDDYASLRNMGTSGSYTFKVEGNNITFRNITVENAAGPVGQAVAMFTTGDCIKFFNCRFLGNQDTLYTGGRLSRLYFENCYIEGTTDFIFGAATALFNKCHIHGKINSYITAASTSSSNPIGYVFHKCKVTAAPGVDALYLGRPWRPNASTYFIECELPSSIHPAGWHNWGDAANETTARYGEYRCTGPGSDESKRVKWRKKLSAESAATLINPDSIFARTLRWNP